MDNVFFGELDSNGNRKCDPEHLDLKWFCSKTCFYTRFHLPIELFPFSLDGILRKLGWIHTYEHLHPNQEEKFIIEKNILTPENRKKYLKNLTIVTSCYLSSESAH